VTNSGNQSVAYNMRRIYSESQPNEGRRVLVDRLWPRGIAKEDEAFDDWLKTIAPSSQLRIWYGHRAERNAEFAQRYRYELQDDTHAKALDQLRAWRREGPVTLLTASRDVEHSHIPVLIGVLTDGD